MSTPHFFSSSPWRPLRPSISPMSDATPKTLHDGCSLHASVNTGTSFFLSGLSAALPPQPVHCVPVTVDAVLRTSGVILVPETVPVPVFHNVAVVAHVLVPDDRGAGLSVVLAGRSSGARTQRAPT